MSTGNLAQIKLTADPKGVKEGTAEAKKYTEQFAKDARKALESLGVSSEKLDEHLENLAEKIKEASEASEDASKKHALLNAELAKSATLLAAGLGLLGPVAQGMAGIATVTELAGIAFKNTNTNIEILDKSLIESQKLAVEFAGNAEGLKKRLEEMGVTAEDVGLKIENEFDRIKTSSAELWKAFSGGQFQKTWDDAKRVTKGWLDWAGNGFSTFAKNVGTEIRDVLDTTAKGVQGARNLLARGLNKIPGMGADDSDIKANEGGDAARAESEKQDKINQLYEAQHAESLARQRELSAAKNEAARQELENIEIEGIKSEEVIKEKLAANAKLMQQLVERNELQTEAGDKLIATEEKLIARSKELGEQQRQRADEMHSMGESLAEIYSSFEKLKEAEVLAQQPLGVLNDLLEEAKENLDEINSESSATTEQRLEALNKVKDLEQRVHTKELQDIRERNEAEIHAINLRLETERKAIEAAQALEEYKLSTIHEMSLQQLKDQGANYQVVHEQRLKFMEEELQLALKNADSEEERNELLWQNEKDKFAANIQMEQQQNADMKQASKNYRDVEDAEIEAANRKKLAKLQLEGAKTEELHKAAMEAIDEEEKRELARTNDAAKQAEIAAAAKIARIREITDFEIQKEKEKADKLKKLEEDVRSGKISYAEGLAQSGVKPMTRAEQNAALKQKAKDRKEAVAKNKEALADKKRLAAVERKQGKSLAATNAKAKAEARAKAGGKSPDTKVLGDIKEELKTIASAAHQTNENESKLIQAVESAGGLA